MIEWNYVNTQKITRIGYNSEVKTLYIDFVGSTFDTPYKDISEEIFIEFSQSDRVDDYYEVFIKDVIEPTIIDTVSTINVAQNI